MSRVRKRSEVVRSPEKPVRNKRKLKDLLEHTSPSKVLKGLARKEARALGHRIGHFNENSDGTWNCRCSACYCMLTVIPALLPVDGRGRGGRALREECIPCNTDIDLTKENDEGQEID